jgi:PiT family inorganic phosphate transporter
MEVPLLLLLVVVVIALAFDFTNGFHDSANAIATVVATGALTLKQALLMAGVLNLLGAFVATQVARTIEAGLIRNVGDPITSQYFILAALLGAIFWNILTWYFAMPSSSSHAIVGGLIGAGIVFGHSQDVVAAVLMAASFYLFRRMHPPYKKDLFRKLQIGSGALMAFSHGSNDAQKTMGVITLALVGAQVLPGGSAIPWWVIGLCAVAMGTGTYLGGKKIITTAGEKITKLEQESGFSANLGGSVVVFAASFMGMPVSTTHVVVGAITGAGYTSHRLGKPHGHPEGTPVTVAADLHTELEGPVRWEVWRHMATAWILTLPGAALAGGLFFAGFRAVFL